MSEPPATLPPALEAAVTFDAQGLVCAVAQQHDSGEVLMVAWMNRAALAETLASGQVCYWSRSRGRLWRKGETSGQTQRLVEMRVDCDGNTLLLGVDQQGLACHTGRSASFFSTLAGEASMAEWVTSGAGPQRFSMNVTPRNCALTHKWG